MAEAPWCERWLWRDTCAARIVLEADDEAGLLRLVEAWDAAFATVQGGSGLPATVFHLRPRDNRWELVQVIDELARLSRVAHLEAAIAHVTTQLGWVALPGELWMREQSWLWLVVDAPPALARALGASGWRQVTSRPLVDAHGGICLGPTWAPLHELTALRVVHRPGLAAPVLSSMRDPEELRAWAHGTLSAQQREWLLSHTRAHRLFFDDPRAAVEAIGGLEIATAHPSSPPRVRDWTLRLGDANITFITQGLTAAEEAQLGGLLGPLAAPAAPARHALALGQLGGSPAFQFMSPRQLRTSRAPELSTTLAYVDTQLQNLLLTLDTAHTLFLGSAVCRQGKVVVLTGPRRTGKSTLALHLVRDHGFHLVCDDYVLWDGARVIAFPKPLRIRGEALARFPEHATTGVTVAAHGDIPAAWLMPAPVASNCSHALPGLWVDCRRSDAPGDTRWERLDGPSLHEAHVRPPPGVALDVTALERELAGRYTRAALHFFDFADAAAGIARRLG